MEKIYFLNKEGTYSEVSELDNAIKENVKKNDKHKRTKRSNRAIPKDKGKADKLASDELHGGGEDPVV